MSETSDLKSLRFMCGRRGFKLRARWHVVSDSTREKAYRVRVATYEVEIIDGDGTLLHREFWADPSRSVSRAYEWLMDNHPRRPGAPAGNRNAAGKRTRPMHRAEVA